MSKFNGAKMQCVGYCQGCFNMKQLYDCMTDIDGGAMKRNRTNWMRVVCLNGMFGLCGAKTDHDDEWV